MYKEHENECIFTVTPYTHGRKNWGKKNHKYWRCLRMGFLQDHCFLIGNRVWSDPDLDVKFFKFE